MQAIFELGIKPNFCAKPDYLHKRDFGATSHNAAARLVSKGRRGGWMGEGTAARGAARGNSAYPYDEDVKPLDARGCPRTGSDPQSRENLILKLVLQSSPNS
jgi:hypothetical protein